MRNLVRILSYTYLHKKYHKNPYGITVISSFPTLFFKFRIFIIYLLY